MRIYKPTDSQYWHVEYQSEDKSTQRSNLWVKDQDEAAAICDRLNIAKLERAALDHTISHEVVTKLTANRDLTVAQAVQEWDDWLALSARSERTHEGHTINIRKWMNDTHCADKPIGSQTTDKLQAWLNADTAGKLFTRRLKMSSLRSFFKFVSGKGWLLHDPSRTLFINFKVLDHTQKETRHKKVFTDDEIEFLVNSCQHFEVTCHGFGPEPASIPHGFFRQSIIIGRYLGIRLGDICNLEWESINFDSQRVKLWMEKSRAWVELPMHPRVAQLLHNIPRRGKYVFPEMRETQNDLTTRANFPCAFGRFLRLLKFPAGYSFHSLRATYATDLANRGATMQEIANALGHANTNPTPAYVRKPEAAKVNLR